MGASTPVILKVQTPEYREVIVEASNGKRYYSDLSSLSAVYCFPKSEADWRDVSIDGEGLSLIWSSRFEVHIDQVIGLATRVEDSFQSA